MNTTRNVIIGSIIVAALALVVLVSVVGTQSPSEPASRAEPPEPVVETSSTYLLAPSTPTALITPPIKHSRPTSTSAPATTTTSEVPPPLTPEQEAKIPGPEEIQEHLPEGSDFDLPSEVEIAEYETPAE